jgi:hypothetical protein
VIHEEQNDTPTMMGSVFRRAVSMTLSWMLMGVMLGLLGTRGSGVIGLAASLTAGVILMTTAGLLLSATGGRWDESLVGGMLGMVFGVSVAFIMGRSDPRESIALGLTSGAFLGATAVTVFYRLPRLVVTSLVPRTEGLPTPE